MNIKYFVILTPAVVMWSPNHWCTREVSFWNFKSKNLYFFFIQTIQIRVFTFNLGKQTNKQTKKLLKVGILLSRYLKDHGLIISSLHDILVILLHSTLVRESLRIASFLCLLLLIDTEDSIVISQTLLQSGLVMWPGSVGKM